MESKEDANESPINYGKLKYLQCPFTWGIAEISKTQRGKIEYKPHDEEDYVIIFKLMCTIVQVFEATMKNDLKEALQYMDESENILNVAKTKDIEDLKISRRAVKHIVLATKCWLFKDLKETKKMEDIFQEIDTLKCNDEDTSTFHGCKSIIWCKYHVTVSEKAIEWAKKALEKEPNCGIWHFIIAKSKRRIRQEMSLKINIDHEELNLFKKAYELSNNSLFHLHYAQALKDDKQWSKAETELVKILRSKPECRGIVLRLAIGFIKLKKFDMAKQCLDSIAKKCGNYLMYLNYRAILLEKQHNFKKAAEYYKLAAEFKNFGADIQYAFCQQKVDPNFDIIKHFTGMLESYKDLSMNNKQELLLHIASCYVAIKKNFDTAIEYYLKAISLNPDSEAINNYINYFNRSKSNVYVVLNTNILPAIEKNSPYKTEATINICRKLRRLCTEHFNCQMMHVCEGMSSL